MQHLMQPHHNTRKATQENEQARCELATFGGGVKPFRQLNRTPVKNSTESSTGAVGLITPPPEDGSAAAAGTATQAQVENLVDSNPPDNKDQTQQELSGLSMAGGSQSQGGNQPPLGAQPQLPVPAMANQMVHLKDALKIIPDFDGKTISITQFMKDCKEALAMVDPAQERNLVKMIRGKFLGEARKTIYGQEFNSLAGLFAFLKRMYFSSRTTLELQGDLPRCHQNPGEKVLSYANRIREIGKKIVEAYEHETNPDLATLGVFETDLQTKIIRFFKRGLIDEIEQKLTVGNDLSSTVEAAIKIENEIAAK